GLPTPTATPTGGGTPTATPTPARTTLFSGTAIKVRGAAGQQVFNTFTATNNTGAAESLSSVTIDLSDPKLFSALALSANGQSGRGVATPPSKTNIFTFSPAIALAVGSSVTFNVTGTIAARSAKTSPSILRSGGVAYAAVEGGANPSPESTAMLWMAMLALLGLAILASAIRSRRWIAVGGALMLIVAVGGCSGGGGSSNSTSSQPGSVITVSGAITIGAQAGLPLRVATVTRSG
ncbi:MAG: hypothetical protein ACREQC_09390, partial [Candidatus Binataceae bacterium]